MPGPSRPPFAPGNRLNPGGRPKVPPEVKALLKQHGPEAVKRIVELMASGDEKVALAAANSIADRAYGKAAQPVIGEDGGPIQVDVGGEQVRAELAKMLASLSRK